MPEQQEDEGKQEERVTIFKAGDEAYAVREGSPGAAKVPASTVDEILKGLEGGQAP
jgi:hypothetical protein